MTLGWQARPEIKRVRRSTLAMGAILVFAGSASADPTPGKPIPPIVNNSPITYNGALVNTPFTDGDGIQGSTDLQNIGSPSTWEYYNFCGNAGDEIVIEVHRTTSAMDPAMQICLGTTDDSDGILPFASCGPDMTLIAAADDIIGIPHDVGGNFQDPRLQIILPETGEYTLAVFDFIGTEGVPQFEIHADGIRGCSHLRKVITSGPDAAPSDGEIDRVVEVGQFVPTTYEFEIDYQNAESVPVLIVDTVPAEWNTTLVDDDGGQAVAAPANKKDPLKSATKINWTPDPAGGTISVQAETRVRPNGRFAPTSCGTLWLNDGAQAFAIDPVTGKPLTDASGNRLPPILESERLCLAAVSDINGDGIILRDGSGDEDGDGFTDLEEACELGTDPCSPN